MNIDELVVKLSLDTKGFTKDQREALDSFRKTQDEYEDRLKNLEARAKKGEHGFNDMTNAAKGLLTVLGGASLLGFTRQAMDAGAAVGRMALNANVATEDLDAFGRVVARNGGQAATAKAQLEGLAGTLQRVRQGEFSPDFALAAAKIGGIDSQKDTPLDIVRKLHGSRGRMSRQEFNDTAGRLGFDQHAANSIYKGSFSSDMDAAKKTSWTKEASESMERLQNSWKTMSDWVEKVMNNVLVKVEPMISGIMNGISGWIEKNEKLATSLAAVLAALTAIASLKGLGGVMRLLGIGGGTAGAIATAGAAKGAGAMATALRYGRYAVGGPAGLAAGIYFESTNEAKGDTGSQVHPYTTGADGIRDYTGGGGSAFSMRGADGKISAEGEAYIRAAAAKFGIDPDIAVRNFKTEGWKSFQSNVIRKDGSRETSYGVGQAFVSPGGRARGMGDQFANKFNLDPSNPANEAALTHWQLSEIARKGSWKDLHGVRKGGHSDTEGINVAGNVNVYLPNVTDPKAAATEIQRGITQKVSSNANAGLRS